MIKLLFLFCVFLSKPAFAYIDPATGNAFFTLAITIVSAILFGLHYIYEHFFIFKGFFSRNKKTIPLLLYSEGTTYWLFFKPILDELEKRKIKTVFYTSSENDPCFSQNYQYVTSSFIGKGNKAYAKMAFVKADIVLMTTPGLDVFQLKRSKSVKKYVHFYHGFGDHCGYRLFGADYYDTLLIDNETNGSYIREIEKKRNLPAKELVVVGDILLDDLKNRIKNIKKPSTKEKIILLSPSWGRESLFYQYGKEVINELLKTDYNIIIRPHPQMKIDNPELLEDLQKKYPNNKKITWDFNLDNLPSMLKSDFMVSDFSGIIYEYSFVLNKPVLCFSKNINLEQYDISDLSELTWKHTIVNQIGIQLNKEDIPNISIKIKELLSKEIDKNIEEISKKYWKERGKCVKNIVDYLDETLKKMEQ